MDIRQLRYFTAVAEELNFTRAAQRLNITQPPLTRQIQALEEGLGVELFVRTSQGVQLTEAGMTLLEDARNLASLVDQSVERAQLAGRGGVGRLDVGFYGTLSFDVLPRIFTAYRQMHPGVDLVLHTGQTPAQIQALREGRVAVVFERQPTQEPDIAVEVVARESVLVALPEGHRLARRITVDVDDLRDEPMILPEGLPPQMSAMAMTLFQAHGFAPKKARSCTDLIGGTVMVACGAGVFLVPSSMSVLAMPGVVYRPLTSRSDATFDVYCFFLRDHRSPLVEALLEVVRRLNKAPALGDASS